MNLRGILMWTVWAFVIVVIGTAILNRVKRYNVPFLSDFLG